MASRRESGRHVVRRLLSCSPADLPPGERLPPLSADAALTPGDLDGDGIPDNQDADIDGDGIPNHNDAHPYGDLDEFYEAQRLRNTLRAGFTKFWHSLSDLEQIRWRKGDAVERLELIENFRVEQIAKTRGKVANQAFFSVPDPEPGPVEDRTDWPAQLIGLPKGWTVSSIANGSYEIYDANRRFMGTFYPGSGKFAKPGFDEGSTPSSINDHDIRAYLGIVSRAGDWPTNYNSSAFRGANAAGALVGLMVVEVSAGLAIELGLGAAGGRALELTGEVLAKLRRISKAGGRHADEAAGILKKYERKLPKAPLKGWKSSQTWNTAENAALLRKNMGSAVNAGEHAHHIVASTHRRAAAARKILDTYQIDINDAANGLGLRPGQHHGTGLHSYEGIDAVTNRLKEAVKGVEDWATGRAKVLEELALIAQEIVDGTFP